MAKEKFLLVDLQEDKAAKLAQVISNKSCRKILDFLADKDATETDLSKQLNIPISTVHYNLEILMKSSLVTVEEYHYSKKGKEVNHYKLANKYIIIAPKTTFNLRQKLKSILPVGLIALAGAGALQFYQKFFHPISSKALEYGTFAAKDASNIIADAEESAIHEITDKTIQKAAASTAEMITDNALTTTEMIVDSAAPVAEKIAENISTPTTNILTENITTQTQPIIINQTIVEPNWALWFFIGATVTITAFMITQYILYKISRRSK